MQRPKSTAISWPAQGLKGKSNSMRSDPVVISPSYTQLQDHLKGLKRDSEKLETLVTKYAKIHDEGPGRRLLFTLKESGGLTDLRRRIGLHEQMLQIWYMTLVYGSLRRLEGGQEDILRAIEAIKNWNPRKVHEVRQSLRKGDIRPLERELSKSGLGPQAVDAVIGTAVDYVDSPPREQVRMESHARSSATVRPEASSFQSASGLAYPHFSFDKSFDDGYGPPPPDLPMHRRKSTGTRMPRNDSSWADENDMDDDIFGHLRYKDVIDDEWPKYPERSGRREKRLARDRHSGEDVHKQAKDHTSKNAKSLNVPEDSRRPRSSSQTINPFPRSPLLVVPDPTLRHRPASYHESRNWHERRSSDVDIPYDQEQVINIQGTPQRHRSVSKEPHPSNRDRRDASTHSYVRRRSSSRGYDGDENAERR